MIKQYERSKERIGLCIERLSGGVVKSNDSTEQSNGTDRGSEQRTDSGDAT